MLGVDPGLTRCGIGVVDGLPGRRLRLVHVEVATTPPDADVATRLLALEVAIGAAIDLEVDGHEPGFAIGSVDHEALRLASSLTCAGSGSPRRWASMVP